MNKREKSKNERDLAIATMKTPVGELRLAADDEGLVAIVFPGIDDAWLDPAQGERSADGEKAATTVASARRQLEEYFAGRRQNFDLPFAPRGTQFQRAVWSALAGISFGTTTTYGHIAAQLGRPDASRAVGAANGRNPLSIVLPCHRVVGAKGALTGYAGGLEKKRWLLEHEGVLLRV